MRVKMGTVVPKMGTFVHLVEEPADYRTAIAMALHEELDDTHRAIKMAMRWTGASERTVKYWFSGERGPRRYAQKLVTALIRRRFEVA